jgi:hypothetical protein
VGFESAQVARRRLALLAARMEEVQVAVAGEPAARTGAQDVAAGPYAPLEELARDILGTPGAGSALLAAYASQARALALVLEVIQRSERPALPASVVQAVRQAMTTTAPMPAIPLGLLPARPQGPAH